MIDDLVDKISDYPNGMILIIELNTGTKIKAKIDTICESDNGLDMDEDGYKEFDACIIEILAILSVPKRTEEIRVGSLMEISIENPPNVVWLEDGTIVWKIGK